MDNSRKTQAQRLSEAELDSLSSRKTQVKRLSQTIDSFDTVLEQDPQRVIEYQAQPASPYQNLPIFPSLPPSSQILWVLLIFVHLWVAWVSTRKK